MCRSTDFQGFYYNNQRRLKIKSFFVRFSNLNLHADKQKQKQFPDSLTLVYLPRINEAALEISGKSIRPQSPAFVTLHRVIYAETSEGEGIYGSREVVTASEGVTFEVYLGEEKVLKGIFRKDEEEEWKLECRSVVEREIVAVDQEVATAEICVGVEGHKAMIERVEMVVKRRKKKGGRRCGGGAELEEIPEEREEDVIDKFEYDNCCCSCGEEESKSFGEGEDKGEEVEEINMEGVGWAIDVGIWVVCLGLGVGYLVSKASTKSLRRKSIFARPWP